MRDFDDLAETVIDEESFLDFLKELVDDWNDEQKKERENPSSPYGLGANGWENKTIVTFLESASRWAEDSKNAQFYQQPENPWTRIAQILYAAKGYE